MAESEGPKLPNTFQEKENTERVIIVLENANLEITKVGTAYQLLNCDDHTNILKKAGKDPSDYRPDISHQMLMALLDSPLNKAGKLEVYIHTAKNVLIRVNPKIRIPRTFKRFAGLMVQLLHKLKIRATSGPEKLLECIRNPVESHFPSKCRKIALSYHADKLVDLRDYVPSLPKGEPVVFVLGAMAHGSVAVDYVDESIAISEYALSGAAAASRLLTVYENMWDIV